MLIGLSTVINVFENVKGNRFHVEKNEKGKDEDDCTALHQV